MCDIVYSDVSHFFCSNLFNGKGMVLKLPLTNRLMLVCAFDSNNTDVIKSDASI